MVLPAPIVKQLGLILFVIQGLSAQTSFSPCDVNHDGVINIADVQAIINEALGLSPCTADLNGDGKCDSVDVQRVITAELGGSCNATAPLETFTYYVDSVNGSDSNPGTLAAPWKTISKVNSTKLSPGQSVGFKRGGTWRETLTPGQSGTVGSPITFGAYGTGEQPILSGLDVVSSWTPEVQHGTDFRSFSTLQGWWLLSEMSNDRADSTPYANTLSQNGTVAHASGPNSVISNAATFVGASSQSLSRTNANLSAGFPGKNGFSGSLTIGAWVKPGDQTGAVEVMNTGCSYGMTINTAGAAATFAIFDDSYRYHAANSTVAIHSGTWYHLVGTWNSSTGSMHVYVNGEDVTNGKPISASMHSTTDSFRIGGPNSCFGNGYYDGAVAEPFVFSSELTGAQVASVFQYGIAGGMFTAYYTTASSDPIQVIEDGVRLQSVASKALLTAGHWYFDVGNPRVYIRTFEDASPSGHNIEIGARDHVITSLSHQYLIFHNLTWRGARAAGMHFWGVSTGLVVDSCVGEYNGGGGFTLYDGTTTANTDRVALTHNTIRFNGATGIGNSQKAFTNWLIDSNAVYSNAQISTNSQGSQTGISVYSSGIDLNSPVPPNQTGQGTVISNNVVYNNGIVNGHPSPYPSQGVGIWLDTINGATVANNLTYGNSGPGLLSEKDIGTVWKYNISNGDAKYAVSAGTGIGSLHVVVDETTNGTGNLFANNTIYGGWWGIYVYSQDTSTISNNIFRNNLVLGAAAYQFNAGAGGNNDGTHGSGNVYDHNAFGPAGATLAYWTGTGAIAAYSELDKAYGSAMNNLQTNPLLANPATGDFTLQTGSPAIGAGVYIPGVSTANPPNIGAK